MHLLSELFYSLWPVVSRIFYLPLVLYGAIGPLYFIANSTSSSISRYLEIPLSSALLTSGITFIEYLLLTFGKSLAQKNYSLGYKKWIVIFLFQLFLCSLFVAPSILFGWNVNQSVFMLFGMFGIGSFAFYLFLILSFAIKLLKKTRLENTPLSRIMSPIVTITNTISIFYPVGFVIIMLVWVAYNPDGGVATDVIHKLHAAIKNTCLIDEKREHCPSTVEGIRIIEPEAYDEVKACCQMKYVYNENNNSYVFAVRYHPTKVAIFGPEISTDEGWDYKEYSLKILGRDKVKNPPPGVIANWVFPEWAY